MKLNWLFVINLQRMICHKIQTTKPRWEKLIQISVLISVQVRSIKSWELCDKSKNRQNRSPSCHKVSEKERYDTQGNLREHCRGICWGLPFLYKNEEVGCRIRPGQGQHRSWLLVRLFKNFNYWWTSCSHSLYGFVWQTSCCRTDS